MEYILDSYAWIEYFNGTEEGKIVNKLFKDPKKRFYTVICCLAEIQGWALKNKGNFENLFRLIKSNSTIIQLTEQDWIQAAKEKHEQRKAYKDFGLIDATLITIQKQIKAKIVSGDKHFKEQKGVIFLA